MKKILISLALIIFIGQANAANMQMDFSSNQPLILNSMPRNLNLEINNLPEGFTRAQLNNNGQKNYRFLRRKSKVKGQRARFKLRRRSIKSRRVDRGNKGPRNDILSLALGTNARSERNTFTLGLMVLDDTIACLPEDFTARPVCASVDFITCSNTRRKTCIGDLIVTNLVTLPNLCSFKRSGAENFTEGTCANN